MKVGIDVSAAVYGTGVSDYVINLVNHLPQPDLVLWGGSLRRGGELKAFFPQARVSPLSPTVAHWLWNQLHIYEIENLVGQIDVWHSSDWAQPPARAKKVTTVHDLSPFLYPQETDPSIVSVHQARMKWVVKECDQIICVSQNTTADLKRLFSVSADRIKVIYEALPERFKLQPQITKQANYVFAIGSRQPRKNIDRLKKACELLQQKLIVVGEGSDIGYVSDQQLVDLLAGASAFVYPSIYEGFGLPILGAFYHSVPVACSNTASLLEVAGDAAVYFDPQNTEGMAKAIAEAVANRSKLIAAGKAQLAKYSWERTADQTMRVYKSLV